MKRKIVYTCLALIGVGLGVAWQAAIATRAAEAALIVAKGERAAAETAARELAARSDAKSRAPTAAGFETVRVSRPATRTPAGILAEQPSASDPAQGAAAVKRYQTGLPVDFYGLYQSTGWGPERIARFQAVLADHEGRVRDLDLTMRDGGLTVADPVIAQLRKEEDARFVAALRDAVGEDGLHRYEQYRAEATLRRAVGGSVAALILTPNPLAPAQVAQLTEAFRANGFARDGGERALKDYAFARTGINVPSGDRASWNAVLTQARTFLTPAQFAELEAQAVRATASDQAVAELGRFIQTVQKTKN